MEHDLVIVSSGNMVYSQNRCFEMTAASNCLSVGDKISISGSHGTCSGTIVGRTNQGNYLICKEEENA